MTCGCVAEERSDGAGAGQSAREESARPSVYPGSAGLPHRGHIRTG